MKRIVVLLNLALIVSCKNKPINDTVDIPENKLSFSIKNEVLYKDIYSDKFDIIQLETSESCLIGEMPSLMVSGNKFFVSETQNGLFTFNKDGKFDKKIGKIGVGPTEYTSFNDMDLDTESQHIMILDLHKIVYYDYNGEFIKSRNYDMPAFSFTKCKDGYWFYIGRNKSYSNYMLCKTDSILMDKKSYLEQHSNLLPMIGKNWSKGYRTTFSENFMNRVYYINNQNLICSYEIDFGELNIPYEVYTVSAFETLPILERKHYAMIEKYIDNGEYAFFLISEHKPSENVKFYHWIINKNTKQEKLVALSNISINSYLLNPQVLSKNNILYCLGYTNSNNEEFEYENKNPIVASIDIESIFNK